MASPLTKAGFESNRNLARPFRAPRVVEHGDGTSSTHWQDSMRLGAKGQSVNTTGCQGVKTTFGVRVKMFGPKRGRRRDFYKKRPAPRTSKLIVLRSKLQILPDTIKLRGKLLTVKIISNFIKRQILPPHLDQAIIDLTRYIIHEADSDILAKMNQDDDHRERSVLGRLKAGQVNKIELRMIEAEIRHAYIMLGI